MSIADFIRRNQREWSRGAVRGLNSERRSIAKAWTENIAGPNLDWDQDGRNSLGLRLSAKVDSSGRARLCALRAL